MVPFILLLMIHDKLCMSDRLSERKFGTISKSPPVAARFFWSNLRNSTVGAFDVELAFKLSGAAWSSIETFNYLYENSNPEEICESINGSKIFNTL